MKGLTLRKLCNVAYAVLIQSIPVEARHDFDQRLRGEFVTPAGAVVQPPTGHALTPPVEQLTREQIAEKNREAMGALMGMMPGAVRA